MDAVADEWMGSMSKLTSGGRVPSFEVMFKIMSLKFHNYEFQGYHSRNKHNHQVKAHTTSLMVTGKAGFREE